MRNSRSDVLVFRKQGHPQNSTQGQGWERTEVSDTLNIYDNSENRTPTIVVEGNGSRESHMGDGYKESDTMYTLNTIERHAVCIENHPNDSRCKISEDGVVQTLSGRMGTGVNNTPMVMEQPILLESNQNHATVQTDGISTTLPASMGMGGGYVPMVTEREAVCVGNGKLAQARPQEKVGALNCMHDQQAVMENNSVVRRLTPLECERLQGFPDGWTDIGEWVDSNGKKHKDADSPRYKALGNSIALPFWQWMAERMVKNLGDHPTMASLFDGIGGFPLVFSRVGCEPVWASEIEEFPIAVTKKRFPEGKDDE